MYSALISVDMVVPKAILSNLFLSSRTNSFPRILLRSFSLEALFDRFPILLLPRKISSVADANKPSEPKSLSSIFASQSVNLLAKSPTCSKGAKAKKWKREENNLQPSNKSSVFRPLQERDFPQELSPEAALLLKRLHDEGYLKTEPGHVPPDYPSRHLIKSAAEKLGQRHQEIAKWLSGSDLKKIALFGCPNVERKVVFAAKRLRSFFSIQEDIICRGCKLKTTCKFVNQRVDKVDRVILADVMRLLTLLAFDAIPQQLSVPLDVKASVYKLLKEAVNLCE
ncbi:hypothetical protein HPP92_004826 [Vanilla planifolia]|uniref:Uncharacterized protein n=1 Tax=Vanilla planifolia TaxID=51239 RepID=A0A835RY91_VANPL|nr:hypothetical protein HPP92_005191 [Vanilla planifolia]KAG0493832.1 hypothetical protein HPP92_004826 [Vanilla planifolia]